MDTKRLILIAGLGVAALVVFTQAKKLGAPAPVVTAKAPAPIIQKVEYVKVLVAAKNLPLGSRLNEAAFEWKQWPAEAVSPAFISNDLRPNADAELLNAIVRSPIVEGEPINEGKLVKSGESGVLAALLRPGMRAVTTRISVDTAAGGFIQPGDRVDVILTQSVQRTRTDGNQGANQRIYISDTVFENVHVLAIDQTFSTSAESGASKIGSTATFEMSQKDAELLQQAVAKGDLTLTLRGIRNSRATAPTTATFDKEETEEKQSILTVYRGGQPQQVAIRGK
ncbi:Flp pilus assembly protein CpaB [Hellea sp.]|nr:Flp pilus assembly protein CpaB [Hellea sp.]